MKISRPTVARSPLKPGRLRATVQVRYGAWLARPEEIWIEVPADQQDQISQLGNPWLAALLPLAFVTGEAIEMESPVDSVLVENARQLQSIWSRWYPHFSQVPIVCDKIEFDPPTGRRRTGCFFSGGADSTYSVLYDRNEGHAIIDELILLHGADISISNQSAFQLARDITNRFAMKQNIPVLEIGTNLRESRFELANWTLLSSTALPAAAGLLLEDRYERLLLSSTWTAAHQRPLGSHPATDPLFSTGRTELVHYGDWIARPYKLEFISQFPGYLQNLRVCWESESGENCGHCPKCVRTMAVLETLGELRGAATFKVEELDLELLRHQYIGRDRAAFETARGFAMEHGREDVAGAIEAAIQRTEKLNRYLVGGLAWMREQTRMNPTARILFRRVMPWFRRMGEAANMLGRK